MLVVDFLQNICFELRVKSCILLPFIGQAIRAAVYEIIQPIEGHKFDL